MILIHYHVTGDWKLIWLLCLPPKIKHFCWRTLHYCLPTQINLQSRGVQCPSTCVACNNDLEDEMQLMTSSGSFASIMFTILATLDVEDRSRFMAILWSIWRAVMHAYGNKNMLMLKHLVF
jgi:hypothetical protein